MEELEVQNEDASVIRLGRALVDWEIDEYPRYQRGKWWYLIGGIAGAACIIYAVATANFLFAVIILMLGVITLIGTFQEPSRVDVIITTTGIVIGGMYYEYRNIKDFSLVYDPPKVKLLYVSFRSAWQPMVAVPLENVDPNAVRDALLPFCAENLSRSEERLTDMLRRMYKL